MDADQYYDSLLEDQVEMVPGQQMHSSHERNKESQIKDTIPNSVLQIMND